MKASPPIVHLAWGHLDVAGNRAFRDAKLYPGGAREWDWGETGTHHQPGIQPADVAELIEHGARVVVLAQGMEECLGVCPETLAELERKGVAVHVLPTEQAVLRYNDLCRTEPVGGLFHSTC